MELVTCSSCFGDGVDMTRGRCTGCWGSGFVTPEQYRRLHEEEKEYQRQPSTS